MGESQHQQQRKSLFVSNLPFNYDVRAFKAKFQSIGPVERFDFPDSKHKSMAFVHFRNLEDAVRCRKLFDGLLFSGKNICIKYSDKDKPHLSSSSRDIYYDTRRDSREPRRSRDLPPPPLPSPRRGYPPDRDPRDYIDPRDRRDAYPPPSSHSLMREYSEIIQRQPIPENLVQPNIMRSLQSQPMVMVPVPMTQLAQMAQMAQMTQMTPVQMIQPQAMQMIQPQQQIISHRSQQLPPSPPPPPPPRRRYDYDGRRPYRPR
ncbi:hypothetical protein TRFO_33276 [Tritrichomonas foetus]|uniref:RRM domain-containing protein n=1 Tax=Tritrichomonas foetus TaxID=1144522 RepID=A0A1J4JP05_9EUKA|nr:hypothetical protein TRFO_33276 [Tritrichomonas foetus]|eukprot:OHT00144.1 hypothetical protein TRFO_33276 [Tritrichomonas foetus]